MRYVFFAFGGLIVALALFRLDHYLISGARPTDKDALRTQLVDFVRVDRDELVQLKERKIPKKPPPPKRPPDPPRVRTKAPSDVPQMALDIDIPSISPSGIGGAGPYLGGYWNAGAGPAVDGEVMPIVRIQPRYPRDALLRGVEGWVHVEFTILRDGSVSDVDVIDSDPPRVFDRSAVHAVLRWKFKPKTVEGEAVERRGSQVIEFVLAQAD